MPCKPISDEPPADGKEWMADAPQPNLVTVILPTHNRASLLPDALDSIVNQAYRPLEILLIDDGSTDQTGSVIQSWQDSLSPDPELQVRVHRQPNRGAPAARNAGLCLARGEFIQFMDSDDVLLPQKIAWQVDCLRRHRQTDYVWSDTELVRDDRFARVIDDLVRSYQHSGPPQAHSRTPDRIPTNAVSGLFRREMCQKLGPWNQTLARHQDWEYMVRLLHLQPCILYIPAKLYVVRLHNQGRISDFGNRQDRAIGIRARLRAAEAAESYAARNVPAERITSAYRRRLLARYGKILRKSLTSLAFLEARQAVTGIARFWRKPMGSTYQRSGGTPCRPAGAPNLVTAHSASEPSPPKQLSYRTGNRIRG